jgi:hypothetical protein
MKNTKELSIKAQFGAIEIELKRGEDFHSFEYKLTDSFSISCYAWCHIIGGDFWMATLSGPWYDDSDPEAKGDSVEEAIANLAIEADWLCKQFAILQKAAFNK